MTALTQASIFEPRPQEEEPDAPPRSAPGPRPTTFIELFPTPRKLAERMLDGINFDEIGAVLEPSAGKGDLAAVVAKRVAYARDRYAYRDNDGKAAIDCIESEPDLRAALKGAGFRVVHDDFLTYHTAKSYDLIVANPPFSDGDRHLLKMLELARYGGRVVCLLNAETLRNPYSFERKMLAKRLAELGAEITYLPGEFESAERRTSVEVALVKVTIPDSLPKSVIIEELEAARPAEQLHAGPAEDLAHGDFVKAIIARYQFEVDVGVRLIREYNAVLPHLLNALHHGKDGDYRNPILELKIDDRKATGANILNDYVRRTRLKYWEALFQAPQFVSKLTSNLQKALAAKVEELGDYEFSYSNILSIQADMAGQTVAGIEDAILKLFDDLSHQHSWYPESSRNVHYYNGWATNKAWKINEKVIMPFYGKDWDGKLDVYRAGEQLRDIERCLCFLAGGTQPTLSLHRALEEAKLGGWGYEVECEHFRVKFYKKGTCHLTFNDERLLARFNIFGSQRKKWLPHNYGRKAYQDLAAEERAVVDSFEGKESYSKVVADPDAFLLDTGRMLALPEHK
ncbi:MAG: DUF4942 domain-containing protein [Deltaproteobacteria bacterium]|nr:DUF4942 domain-containing protein [Deltaproteobacteria bacterium]